MTYQNDIQEEVKGKVNSENTSCPIDLSLLASRIVSKNVKIKPYETITLPVTLCANETWFLASGKTATESI
jgi:hypothetical protein